MERHTVIETFAGAGGLALGLEMAGLDTTLLVEFDHDCAETLRINRPKWNVVEKDIHEVSFSECRADVVSGGFPCQAFSHAGKKLGFEDVRGTLFFEFVRCVKEVKPKLFLAENVEGLIRHDSGKTFKTVLNILKSLGYKVQHNVLNAANYSVPQKRKRLFIVGTTQDIIFIFPPKQDKTVTLREALRNVPQSEGVQYSEAKKRILSNVPPGGSWVDLPIEMQKEYMGKSFYSSGGRRGMARRLSFDELCLTLTTSPFQKFTERCHPEETRPFTVREYARIQTFPDSWEFSGSTASRYRQIGNAVPVNLAKALGKSIVYALEGKNKTFF